MAPVVLILAICAIGGTPFPLGIYGVHSTNDFPVLRDVGFNLVTGPAEKPYLDAARVAGLKVLATVNPDAKPASLARLDRHPALWAWYLSDEPDLHLVPPATLEKARSSLRRAGLRKPIALTLWQGYETPNYGDLPDILMIDRYPVPWLPLANFGQHLKMARLSIGKQKPLIGVIQAFDWSAYPNMLRGEKNLRPPTLQEMRCMAYDGLTRGANGYFFYEFHGTWKIREHPPVWDALKTVVKELNDRRPLFEGQPLWWPREHEFSDPRHRFNAALESSVSSVLLRVVSGANEYVRMGNYIVAVNNSPQDLVYSFSLPPSDLKPAGKRQEGNKEPEPAPQHSNSTPVPVLGESRSVTPAQNWITDTFPAYEIHIYGPLP